MPSTPLHVVQETYAAFARRDVPKALGLFSPDIEIVQSTDLPWGGTYHGHDGAKHFFGKLTAAINSTVTIDRLIDAGEHIAAIGWTSGTVNATGTGYRVPIAHIWKVRDGRVVQIQFFIDHPTMLAAIGPRWAGQA